MCKEMETLSSRLLQAFPHGFTTRRGGHSRGCFASLNLGSAVGDDPKSIEANWAEVARATGLSFARVRQVHGSRVHHASEPELRPSTEADAVVSARPGLAACVSVADCVPILVADPRSGAVAAVHAGWRGTLARVAEEAVRALLREHGARAGDLLAAIGPSIGPCCYEVSPELAGRFRREIGPGSGEPRRRGSRVDLWLASESILKAAGLARERVEIIGRCTSCEPDLFFSHRRDIGRTGRQVAFIGPFLD
jgi:polyphenol oxidase